MKDLKFGVFDHVDRDSRSLMELYEQRLKIVEPYDRPEFISAQSRGRARRKVTQ